MLVWCYQQIGNAHVKDGMYFFKIIKVKLKFKTNVCLLEVWSVDYIFKIKL